jgi:hypothetical protein
MVSRFAHAAFTAEITRNQSRSVGVLGRWLRADLIWEADE